MAPEFEENRTEAETAVIPAPQPTYQEIAARAYLRYMERGCVGGSALEDWLAAEAELQPAVQTQTPVNTRRRAARGAGEQQRSARTASKPTRIGRTARTSPKPAR